MFTNLNNRELSPSQGRICRTRGPVTAEVRRQAGVPLKRQTAEPIHDGGPGQAQDDSEPTSGRLRQRSPVRAGHSGYATRTRPRRPRYRRGVGESAAEGGSSGPGRILTRRGDSDTATRLRRATVPQTQLTAGHTTRIASPTGAKPPASGGTVRPRSGRRHGPGRRRGQSAAEAGRGRAGPRPSRAAAEQGRGRAGPRQSRAAAAHSATVPDAAQGPAVKHSATPPPSI